LHLNKHTLFLVLRPNPKKVRVLNRIVRNLKKGAVRFGIV